MELRRERTAHGWKIVLERDESPVSWCSVVERTMRFGVARLRVGGIGGVGTAPRHRRHGYARRVLEDALDLMEAEHYQISFLHGIQDFYGKFGYVTCMPEYELWLETRDAERAQSSLPTRRLQAADRPEVVRLYNRENRTRTGSAVRRPENWSGFAIGTWWSIPAKAQVILDSCGGVAGYVVFDDTDTACRASEVGGGGEGVYAAVLRFLARRAVRLRQQRIWLHLPEDHSFSIYCRQFGLRSHTLYPRAEKAMGRIMDLPGCMRELCPELARRWRRSGSEVDGIGLHTDIGTGRLQRNGDQCVWESQPGSAPLELSHQDLTQLIFGYVRPADLETWGRVRIPPGVRQLAGDLFPLQQAQLWWSDRF